MKIIAYGDPHGEWQPLVEAVHRESPDLVLLLGDMDLDEPLGDKLARLLPGQAERVWWIHGNHECHSLERLPWHDNLFESHGLHVRHNLDGRVVEIGGLRIAGLGGHFQGAVWHPHSRGGVRFPTREAWMCANRERWRGGLPLKRRAAIWWEDYASLFAQRADLLVTHEAPGCHRYGFSVLDELADAMGASLLVHGHQHEDYIDSVCDERVCVVGVNRATPVCLPTLSNQPSTSVAKENQDA